MNLGAIGNCQYSALVAPDGSIPWLCWPRFDSSFVFGGLVDGTCGGVFRIAPATGGEGVQSYIENTNVLRTVFTTDRGSFELIDFAPRFRLYERFFRPTMLIRVVRPLSGEPSVRVECSPRYDYGETALVAAAGSNHLDFAGAPQPVRLTTDAALTHVLDGRKFLLTSPRYFVLTWGPPFEAPLRETCEDFLERTVAYWQRWVKHCHLPREFQREVIRSALVLKLHQFEDTGAVVASTTTSIPEAAGSTRNWDYRYCWLRDAHFTISALHRLTHFEEMEGFEAYLRNIVESSTGPLQPVYDVACRPDLDERILPHLGGYRGHAPVRVGNQAYQHLQHDLYGEMLLAISPLYLDVRFAPYQRSRGLVEKLLDQVEAHLEKEDAGLWEFRGISQVHTFSLLMHWAGARAAAEIGSRQGYDDLRDRAAALASRADDLIRTRCWSAEVGAFAQAADTSEMDASLLMLINLQFLDPRAPEAESHLRATIARLSARNGLLHRYVHTDDFGATDNAFTVCSFWLAEACARLGHVEEARRRFTDVLRYANPLGLFSEDIDPTTGEQWGNFPQTYSHVGLIHAAFAVSRPWDPSP